MSYMSVENKIQHYQKSIERCNGNEVRLEHCITRLCELSVTVKHLQVTGVGRTVNALRKFEGNVGTLARALVAKWKKMVVDEGNSDEEEEDEACVPDAPETYKDSDDHDDFSGSLVPEKNFQRTTECERNTEAHKISSHESKTKSGNSSSNIPRNILKDITRSEHDHRKDLSTSKKSSCKNDAERSVLKDRSHSDKKSKDTKDESEKRKEDHDSRHKSSKDKSSKKYSRDKEDKHRKRKIEESAEETQSQKKKKYSQSESDRDNYVQARAMSGSEDEKSSANGESDELAKIHSKVSSSSSLRVKTVQSPKDKKKEKYQDSSSKHKSGESRIKHSDEKSDRKQKESHHSNKESSKSKDHSSSSSKDSNRKKDRKDDGTKKSLKKDKSDKHSKDSKVKKKLEINGDDGIDCNSGTSFAEALGMCTKPAVRKRNNTSSQSHSKLNKMDTVTSSSSLSSEKTLNSSKQNSSITSTSQISSPPLPSAKLEPLNVDLTSTLPEISPNYKPLPSINPNPLHRRQEEDRILSEVIYVKNQRTKVYSGNKTGYTSVPSLYELCIRVLIENIDALEYTGGVPFYIIRPILERANPDQLFALEHHNPYLIEETDSLWQFHCNKEFRSEQKEEMESWREMYMRCLEEREAKLKMLTANIKRNAIDKSQPVRVAKLAYVDNIVKPPRNVLRKQAKYGTAKNFPTAASDVKKKLIAGAGSAVSTNISVPSPPVARMRANSSAVGKKTKAPLMAKALQLIKGRYKR